MANMVLFTVTHIAFNPLYPTVFYIGTCPGAGPRVPKKNTIHGPAKGFKHVTSTALHRVNLVLRIPFFLFLNKTKEVGRWLV